MVALFLTIGSRTLSLISTHVCRPSNCANNLCAEMLVVCLTRRMRNIPMQRAAWAARWPPCVRAAPCMRACVRAAPAQFDRHCSRHAVRVAHQLNNKRINTAHSVPICKPHATIMHKSLHYLIYSLAFQQSTK